MRQILPFWIFPRVWKHPGGSLLWLKLMSERPVPAISSEGVRQLGSQQDRYQRLFNSIRDAILVADQERKIQDCNRAFTELFGYPLEDIAGQKTKIIYESEQEFLDLGRAIKENTGKDQFYHLVKYRKKNGDIFPGETNVFYQKDQDGNVVGLIGLIRDVTDKLKIEEQLRQERDLLEQLMATSPVGIMVFDKQRSLTFQNSWAQKILGQGEPEISQNLKILAEHSTWNEIFNRVMDLQSPLRLQEVSFTDSQGRERVLMINAATLKDQFDQSTGVVCSMQDVTHQIREQDRLSRQLYREMEILDGLISPRKIQITASSLGLNTILESTPEIYQQILTEYCGVLDLALEQKLFLVDHDLSSRLRKIAGRLGALRASPRDVVDLHTRAVQEKKNRTNQQKYAGYVEEGRLVLLELMGFLTAYYRYQSLGIESSEGEG